MEDSESALNDLNKAISIDGSNPDNYYNRAILMEEIDRFGDAVKDYTKVIELNPKDANAYFNRGSCYANADNFAPAIEDLSKAVLMDPSNGNYFRVLGNTKYRYNELEGDPCGDWQKASELGDKKAAFSLKRFCQNN